MPQVTFSLFAMGPGGSQDRNLDPKPYDFSKKHHDIPSHHVKARDFWSKSFL